MEAFLSNGATTVGLQYYDCRVANKSWEFLKQTRVSRPYPGVFFLVWGILGEIAYGLCVVAFTRPHLRKHSSYKIIFTCGLYDMCSIVCGSLIPGVMFLFGSEYCFHPTLHYVHGCFTLFFWCGSCLGCFVLVVNRLLEQSSHQLAVALFKGNRTYFMILLCAVYPLYVFFLNKPVLFDSSIGSYSFNPGIQELENSFQIYYNYGQFFNNTILVPLAFVLFLVFVLIFVFRYGLTTQSCSTHQKQIFIQTGLMSATKIAIAIVYAMLNFIEISDNVLLASHFAWQFEQVSIPIFFLLFNRSVRQTVMGFFQIEQKRQIIISANRVQDLSGTL